MKELLENDPPYGAKVTFEPTRPAPAGTRRRWRRGSTPRSRNASTAYFGKPAVYMGEGGSIPFMGMLGAKFPKAQFLITGVLGPKSNAHGPNEFLHLPTGEEAHRAASPRCSPTTTNATARRGPVRSSGGQAEGQTGRGAKQAGAEKGAGQEAGQEGARPARRAPSGAHQNVEAATPSHRADALSIRDFFRAVAAVKNANLGARAAEPAVRAAGGRWPLEAPATFGLDEPSLAAAVATALPAQIAAPRDMKQFQANSFGKEPHGEPIGPLFDRGGPAGVVVHRGHLVAQWGDVWRPDMCNSVAKSFLTAVVGLAFQHGLLADVDDRVASSMPAGVDLFAAEANQPITWDHFVSQDYDWRGELWGNRIGRIAPRARPRSNGSTIAPRTRHLLRTQRRARERAGPGGATRAAATAADGAARRDHAADRRQHDLALARLRQRLARPRRPTRAGLDRRRPLGRRPRDPHAGPRALRPLVRPRRPLGRATRARRTLAALARTLRPGERGLRLRQLVPQHRPQGDAGGAGQRAVRFLGNGGNVVYFDRDHDLVVVARWVREEASSNCSAGCRRRCCQTR